MVYKNYNRTLFLKLCLTIIVAIGIGLFIGYKLEWLFVVGLSIVEILLVANLIIFLNRTNRQINFFIKAVKNEDTTLRFPKVSGNKIINELHLSLNELNSILQELKIKTKIREKYFSEIMQNIDTGIVVFNEKGFILNVNRALLELLGLQVFTHVSQLDKVDKNIKAELMSLNNHSRKSVIIRRNNEAVTLSVGCTIIELKDEEVKLVTIQDIRNEIERTELDSWVKVIKVLNHEIMNSLAPVTSIAQSLKNIWEQDITDNISQNIAKTIDGLDVIVERGDGLMRFVQNYRMFTKIPEIFPIDVDIQAFFDRLSILVSPMKTEFGVTITFHPVEPTFKIKIDEQMMIQVIINLIKNGCEALCGTPNGLIEIFCHQDSNKSVEIHVCDNGPGISDEILDEIFVPFFTTKQTGTGIGLSYSRQILRAHGGSISVRSKQGETVFVVLLRNC